MRKGGWRGGVNGKLLIKILHGYFLSLDYVDGYYYN